MINSSDFLEQNKDILNSYSNDYPDTYDVFFEKINSLDEVYEGILDNQDLCFKYFSLDIPFFEEVTDFLFSNYNNENYSIMLSFVLSSLNENDYNSNINGYKDFLNFIVAMNENNISCDYIIKVINFCNYNYDKIFEFVSLSEKEIIDRFSENNEDENQKNEKSEDETDSESIKVETSADDVEDMDNVQDFNLPLDLGISLIQNNSNNDVLKALDQISHMILVIRDKSTSAFTELSNYKKKLELMGNELMSTKNELSKIKEENKSLVKELEVMKKKQESMNNLLNSN